MELKNKLELAMDDFKKITGLRCYLVFSKEDLNSASERNFFCKSLKTSAKALKLCEECALETYDTIEKSRKEFIYSCHGGLIKWACPVFVGNEMKCMIVAEGVLNRKQLEESDQWTEYLSKTYDVSASVIKNTFEVVTVMNEVELNAAVQLLKDLVDYRLSI